MSVPLQHLAVIEAQLELLKVQILALRQVLTPPPSAKESAPILRDECLNVPPDRCALQNDDAKIDRRTFGTPDAFRCKGCGHDFNIEATA